MLEADLDGGGRTGQVHVIGERLHPVVVVAAPVGVARPRGVDEARPESVPLTGDRRRDVPRGRRPRPVDVGPTPLVSGAAQSLDVGMVDRSGVGGAERGGAGDRDARDRNDVAGAAGRDPSGDRSGGRHCRCGRWSGHDGESERQEGGEDPDSEPPDAGSETRDDVVGERSHSWSLPSAQGRGSAGAAFFLRKPEISRRDATAQPVPGSARTMGTAPIRCARPRTDRRVSSPVTPASGSNIPDRSGNPERTASAAARPR
jgi:hypothetical protein